MTFKYRYKLVYIHNIKSFTIIVHIVRTKVISPIKRFKSLCLWFENKIGYFILKRKDKNVNLNNFSITRRHFFPINSLSFANYKFKKDLNVFKSKTIAVVNPSQFAAICSLQQVYKSFLLKQLYSKTSLIIEDNKFRIPSFIISETALRKLNKGSF